MFLKLVERYSHRANWRGYTYVDEMRGQALVQLSQIGLQFNEAKSDNPFAYYTAAVNNSFTRVLNLEKRNQTIRDDILIEQGHLPSYGRQIKHEEELRAMREAAEESSESLAD
jgi:Xaa-Pro aminopeptidase